MKQNIKIVSETTQLETQTTFYENGSFLLTPHSISVEEWSYLFNNISEQVPGVLQIHDERIIFAPIDVFERIINSKE